MARRDVFDREAAIVTVRQPPESQVTLQLARRVPLRRKNRESSDIEALLFVIRRAVRTSAGCAKVADSTEPPQRDRSQDPDDLAAPRSATLGGLRMEIAHIISVVRMAARATGSPPMRRRGDDPVLQCPAR